MKQLIFIFCYFFALTLCTPPRITKVYRTDYEYNKNSDAFYKLHIESYDFVDAKEICKVEEAMLMVPATDFDVMQLNGMLKKYPDLDDVWINGGDETNSAEENPNITIYDGEFKRDPVHQLQFPTPVTNTCETMSRQGDTKSTWCNQQRPFICKVEAKDAPYDPLCDVYGTNYEYVASVGSCYKISSMAYSWNEAYAECQAQAAHLVVLNSEAEREAVKQIMEKSYYIKRSYSLYYYIAGYRAKKPSGTFMTIFNQTLEEAGYSEWAHNTKPNSADGNEFCGFLYTINGKLSDGNCIKTYGFICEKEKHI